MNDEKIIMYDSPEAAKYVTNIEGWVDSRGRFFGKGDNAEHMARFSGCTHVKCESCGGKIEKGWLKCSKCRAKAARERYNALPCMEWDGEEPVCTTDGETYFFTEFDLIEYMEENEMTEIDLLICSPVLYSPINADTIAGDAYEDWEPDKMLSDKINEFNAYLRTLAPHSWKPGKIRTHYTLDND